MKRKFTNKIITYEEFIKLPSGTSFLIANGERYAILSKDTYKNIEEGDVLHIDSGEILNIVQLFRFNIKMHDVHIPESSLKRTHFAHWFKSDLGLRMVKLGRSYDIDHTRTAYKSAFNAGYRACEEEMSNENPENDFDL